MKKAMKNPKKKRETRKPQKWDKCVSAAYLRLLGATQKQAGKQVGVHDDTIHVWEHRPWWPDAVFEARSRWLRGGDAAAMRGLLKAFDDPEEYAQHARWWADRRIPEMAPPKQRVDSTVSTVEKYEFVYPKNPLDDD